MNDIEKAIIEIKHHRDSWTLHEISNESCDLAISALEHQLTNGWIPVTERLPEETSYPPIICCNTKDNWTDAAIIIGQCHFVNSEGMLIYPTHWQPLPEPYKEASHDRSD